MGKFFRFERMITPLIIQVLFWVGFIGTILAGLFLMITSLVGDGGFGGVFTGLMLLLLGPIGVRIYCEILIVAFKLLGLLVDVRDRIT